MSSSMKKWGAASACLDSSGHWFVVCCCVLPSHIRALDVLTSPAFSSCEMDVQYPLVPSDRGRVSTAHDWLRGNSLIKIRQLVDEMLSFKGGNTTRPGSRRLIVQGTGVTFWKANRNRFDKPVFTENYHPGTTPQQLQVYPGGISAIGSTRILVQLGSCVSTPGRWSCNKIWVDPIEGFGFGTKQNFVGSQNGYFCSF